MTNPLEQKQMMNEETEETKIEKPIPNNNWDKQFNKIYYSVISICAAMVLAFNLYNIYKVSAEFNSETSLSPSNSTIFLIIECLTQIIGTVVAISVIFLVGAIILKIFKKLVNYNFIPPLAVAIIVGSFMYVTLVIAATPIAKPVIYLYPEEKQDVSVQINFQGKIIADYPRYDKAIKGWKVTAYPDGHLIDHRDNQEYSYLFWEGKLDIPVDWDFSKGFVVKGENTREFLQQILPRIGLTPKEYNEFIVYWYPLMKDNSYNLIHFANEQYAKTAPLTITPKPDSMLRVFMVFKALDKKIEIEPQVISSFERKGFTVVEWGGTRIK
jgi:hypothetical protein